MENITENINKNIKKTKKTLFSRILIILAWVVPIGIISTILYYNFLPFGYENTYVINVGEEDDTKGDFYLEENDNLGSRQIINGESLRYLDGHVYAVYKPKPVLNNAQIIFFAPYMDMTNEVLKRLDAKAPSMNFPNPDKM